MSSRPCSMVARTNMHNWNFSFQGIKYRSTGNVCGHETLFSQFTHDCKIIVLGNYNYYCTVMGGVFVCGS